MKTLKLPIPPSVNAAYGNRKSGKGPGRYKTSAYKAWERLADGWAMEAGLFRHGVRPFVTGKAVIVVRLPVNMRGDVYNRGKVPEDWLVSRGFTADDKHNDSVECRRDPTMGRVQYCLIDISEAA